MTDHSEILDPYAEPDDDSDVEIVIAHRVARGTGGRLFRTAAVGVVALLAGFLYVRAERSASDDRLAQETSRKAAEPPTVEVVAAAPSDPVQTITLPGEAAAWDETTIYSRVNGYVSKWFVDIGDHVATGQSLATIETPELDAELVAAKAKLNVSVAQVAVKQAQEDFAAISDARWRNSPKGVVSDEERDSKKAGKAEAEANLNAARAQVQLEQAEVDRLTALAGFKTVKAPFAGTIVQRHINTGDLVTAGSTVNTSSLYRLEQENPMRVFVYAPQSLAARLVQTDATAEVTIADQPDSRLSGKVARTAKSLNANSRTLRTEIDIPNANHALLPGMYVQVALRVEGEKSVQVPPAALQFRSGGPRVAVVDDKGIVEFRDVVISSDDGNLVAIRSGLNDGDRIIVNLSSEIVDGQKVQTHELNVAAK
jgi:RND family efflux transporter MFP subunit